MKMLVRLATVAAFSVVLADALSAQPPRGRDGGEFVGKVWEYEVRKIDRSVDSSGKVRVRKFDLFGPAGRQLGTYKMLDGERMEVTFSAGPYAGYVADMRLTKRRPLTWNGFAVKDGAERLQFQFIFAADWPGLNSP